MARIRHGNNIELTGKDFEEYCKVRFPNTCTTCFSRPSMVDDCKACDGTGMKNKKDI